MSATTRLQFSLPHSPRRQRGAILVIALMFLVLLTIVAVSSISGVTLEEKMAGNLRDQTTAFQAAESALRDAEIDLEPLINGTGNRDNQPTGWTVAARFATLCSAAFTTGVCTTGCSPACNSTGTNYKTQAVTPAFDWTDVNKTVVYGTYTGAARLPSVAQQPKYVIEYLAEKDDTSLGPTPLTRYFRITARGWGASQTSSVTLQTIYKMPNN
jgi:type IV pilus assembly protein PilX